MIITQAPGSTLPPDPEEAPSANGGGSGGSNKEIVLVPSGLDMLLSRYSSDDVFPI